MHSIGSAVLSKIIAEQNVTEFLKLLPEWFVEDERKYYDFIKSYYEEHKRLPTQSAVARRGLLPLEEDEPLQALVSELLDRHIGNIFSQEIPKFNALLGNDNTALIRSLEKVVERAKTYIAAKDTTVRDIVQVGENLVNVIRQRRQSGGITGIPTGWKTLDMATNGLQGGEIFVVVARVKMGKSLILTHMAGAAYDAGYSVMFVSMEMPEVQIGGRFFAEKASIGMSEINRGTVSTWGERKLVELINQYRDKQPFYFVEGQLQKNIDSILSLIHLYKPNVVYIDGGYLIRSDLRHAQKWEKVAHVVEKLKTTSMQLNIPIVVSFQFNRQISRHATSIAEDAFESIHLSDAISQIASTGIGIIRDETESDDVRVIEIIGGRHGEAGRFRIRWNWERMDFSEIEEYQYNENTIRW